MTIFKYSAVDTRGKEVSGLLDADTLSSAKGKLSKRKLVILSLFEKRSTSINLDSSMLLSFTRDLSQLLGARLPLVDSLLSIEEKYVNTKYHFLFLDILERIRGGDSLSVALSAYPKSFNNLYISLVASGEKSGDLSGSFKDLEELLSRSGKFKKKMKAALTYPIFLGGFSISLLMVILIFLVPSIKEILVDSSLSLSTRIVISISDFLINHSLSMGLSLIGIVVILLHPKFSRSCFIKRVVTRLPLYGKLSLYSCIANFSRALGALLYRGVSIEEAMELAIEFLDHPKLEDIKTNALDMIVRGEKLSFLLQSNKSIPILLVRMVKTSEEIGSTGEMLIGASKLYEEMVSDKLDRFTNLLQPVMLLLLGGIVGFILLSVVIPMSDVSGIMGGI